MHLLAYAKWLMGRRGRGDGGAYSALVGRLTERLGKAEVFYDAYPTLTKRRGDGYLVIYDDHGAFDVGFTERGEWTSLQRFATIQQACDFVWTELTKPKPPAHRLTPEERAHSEEATRQLKAEFDAYINGMGPKPE